MDGSGLVETVAECALILNANDPHLASPSQGEEQAAPFGKIGVTIKGLLPLKGGGWVGVTLGESPMVLRPYGKAMYTPLHDCSGKTIAGEWAGGAGDPLLLVAGIYGRRDCRADGAGPEDGECGHSCGRPRRAGETV